MYSSKFGRWLSRDPAGEAGGDNLYEYAKDDPINWDDATGMTPTPAVQPAAAATKPTAVPGFTDRQVLALAFARQIQQLKRSLATEQKWIDDHIAVIYSNEPWYRTHDSWTAEIADQRARLKINQQEFSDLTNKVLALVDAFHNAHLDDVEFDVLQHWGEEVHHRGGRGLEGALDAYNGLRHDNQFGLENAYPLEELIAMGGAGKLTGMVVKGVVAKIAGRAVVGGVDGTAAAVPEAAAENEAVTALYHGTSRYAATEMVDNQAFNLERLAAHQADKSFASGLYTTSQEATADYWADLSFGGINPRAGGPAIVKIEMPSSQLSDFLSTNNLSLETPVSRMPGQTETFIPMQNMPDFNNLDLTISIHKLPGS